MEIEPGIILFLEFQIHIKASLRSSASYDASKKYSCCYCNKLGAKLSRHLSNVHKEEPEVKAIFAETALGSDEWKRRWLELQKRGAYKHNIKVIKNGTGTLLVRKQPSKGVIRKLSDYRCCPECYGFYKKETIRAHLNKCSKTVYSKRELKRFFNTLATEDQEDKINLVLDIMEEDEVKGIIKNDALIRKHGLNIFEGFNYAKAENVSYRMRLLGRLVKQVRTIEGDNNIMMQDIIHPRSFDTVIKAVKLEANVGASVSLKGPSTPSTALKMGHELKHATHIYINAAIRCDDQASERRGENFKKLHEREWGVSISKHSLKSLQDNKRQPVIPYTSDIQVSVFCSNFLLACKFPVKVYNNIQEFVLSYCIKCGVLVSNPLESCLQNMQHYNTN